MRADTLIIDGRHALWRTSDAFKMLSVELGDREIGTGGMYGFLSILIKIHQRYGGETFIAWEGKNNFRKTLYPDYKKKPELDEDQLAIIRDMGEQEMRLKAMLRLMGVKQYYGIKCEADDVIGRLAREATEEERVTVIYSGDSDLRQLVNEFVFVAAPGFRGKKDTLFDQEGVLEKHGVPPGYIADLKALSGDSSDNIPGVNGIGPVTAVKLIQAYGGVGNVIKGARGKMGEIEWPVAERFKTKITDAIPEIKLFKKLTRIRTKYGMGLIKPKRDKKMLIKHFMAYRFASLLASSEMYELLGLSNVS